MRPIDVLVLTPDLRVGGAERHLSILIPALREEGLSPSVVCIKDRGPFEGDLRREGVPVSGLDTGESKLSMAVATARLVRRLRRDQPQVVMSQGLVAGALGRIAARAAGVGTTIVWKHNNGHLGATA
jgi:hypothetical protein